MGEALAEVSVMLDTYVGRDKVIMEFLSICSNFK